MKQTVEEAATYTEGICGNGAAILKDGVMMTIPEVLKELNKAAASLPTNSMHTQPEEREERVRFFTMQQFPTQEPGEIFSKTVLIYNKEDNSFCDLGFYDFETSEWAILGDMSMKLICWCYIPDASIFIKGKELKQELHRGYC